MAQKTALMTGAAQGIGAGIARVLAGRGYAVAVADMKEPAAGFFYVRTDVSREPAVRACVRAAAGRTGKQRRPGESGRARRPRRRHRRARGLPAL